MYLLEKSNQRFCFTSFAGGLPDVIPLFIMESQSFSGAVSSLFSYIHTVTNCCISYLPSANAQQFVSEKSQTSVFVIVMSKDMLALLRNSDVISPKEMDFLPETEEMRKVLNKIKGKQFKKVIVTFRPISGELRLLPDTQIFDLSLFSQSETRGDFGMNLCQILKTITGNEDLPANWCNKEQTSDLQEKISVILPSDLMDCADNVMDPIVPAPGLIQRCIRNCPIPVSGNCQQACGECLERYKYSYDMESRNVKSYQSRDYSDEGFYSRDTKDMAELQLSVLQGEDCNAYNGGIEDFVPQAPDSDTESDSFSTLVLRKEEINRNYMTVLREEQCQGKHINHC